MTKKEFIQAMEDMPDDAPVMFWDFNHDCWLAGKPYLMDKDNKYDYDEDGNKINYTFIGIE